MPRKRLNKYFVFFYLFTIEFLFNRCNLHDYLEVVDDNSTIQICRDSKIKFVLSTKNKLSIRFKSTGFAAKHKGIQFSVNIWGNISSFLASTETTKVKTN